jgi:hypothetical protein
LIHPCGNFADYAIHADHATVDFVPGAPPDRRIGVIILSSPKGGGNYFMADNRTIVLSSCVMLSRGQISSELGGEIVIMDLENGVYHGVQGVSAFIWNQLGKPISVREICDRVTGEYDVDASRCQADVITLIQQLLDEGLVEFVHSSSSKVSVP